MQVSIFVSCLLLVVQLSEQRGHHKVSSSRQLNNGEESYYAPTYNGYYPSKNVRSSASSSSAAMSSSSSSISSSASESFTVIQERWTKTHSYCNTALGRVANFISKIEETTLGLPLQMIKAALGIPSKVVHLSIDLAESLLPNLERAKLLLQGFFQTVFDLPAKALYGSISIFLDLINKILDWGQTCHGQNVCRDPIPNVGGYGPCAGRWPCTRVTACQTNSCISAARALELDASNNQELDDD